MYVHHWDKGKWDAEGRRRGAGPHSPKVKDGEQHEHAGHHLLLQQKVVVHWLRPSH